MRRRLFFYILAIGILINNLAQTALIDRILSSDDIKNSCDLLPNLDVNWPKNKNIKLIRAGSGGEGRIYVKYRKSHICYKNFYNHNRAKLGVASLLFVQKEINLYPNLSRYLIIPQVYKKNSSWLKRDYYPKAIKLKMALATDDLARERYSELKDQVLILFEHDSTNEFLAGLYQRIEHKSTNIMWLKKERKFVWIDIF